MLTVLIPDGRGLFISVRWLQSLFPDIHVLNYWDYHAVPENHTVFEQSVLDLL